MKKIILFVSIIIVIFSCQDITVGYLDADYAAYSIDSMVVKKVLDPKPGNEDYNRLKYDWPWTGTKVEGVQGTLPIYATIAGITTINGDAYKMKAELTVRGDGTFSLPIHNNVPAGRYYISLKFANEGYEKEIKNIFTIIVK